MRRIMCIVIVLTVCNISVLTLIFDSYTDFILIVVLKKKT